MVIEEYRKTKDGKVYYNIYFRFGTTQVQVIDITADSKEKAKEKAGRFLDKAIAETEN